MLTKSCLTMMVLLAGAALAVPPSGAQAVLDADRLPVPEAQELTVLRTEFSNTYSTGDGRAVTRIYSEPVNRLSETGEWRPLVTDALSVVYPQNITYWTGTIEYDGVGSYTKPQPKDPRWGKTASVSGTTLYRGYVKFDLTTIAGGAEVTDARLYYWVISANGEPVPTEVRLCNADPVVAGAQETYDAIGAGALVGSGSSVENWNNIILAEAAEQAIQDSLLTLNAWIVLGFSYPGSAEQDAKATGCNGGPKTPYIEVTHTLPPPTDVEAVQVLAPTGTVMWNTPCQVQAEVRNNATWPVRAVPVRFGVVDGSGWNTTRRVDIPPSTTVTVDFADWVPSVAGNDFQTRCTTMLDADPTPGNNLALGLVSVLKIDAETQTIDAPSGTVNHGETFQPLATVRNNSSQARTITARFTIGDGSGYASEKTTPLLDPDQSHQLEFDDWTANFAGAGFETRCTTMLTGDQMNSNDEQTGTVSVVPGAPGLTAPPDGDTVNNPTLSFSWENLGTTVTYHIQVDDDEQFLSIDREGWPAANSWTPGTGLGQLTWYWRVCGAIPGAEGPWSEVWDVTIDIIPPAVPVLISPIGGEIVNSMRPLFDWEPIPDARTFNLEVYDEFDALVLEKSIVQAAGEDRSSYLPAYEGRLANNANYTWQVEALDYATNSSGFCSPEAFRVECSGHDVGATAILAPAGSIVHGAVVYPKVQAHNYGTSTETFDVRVIITDAADEEVFNHVEQMTDLGPGQTAEMEFSAHSWTATPVHAFHVLARTELPTDADPGNDAYEQDFRVGVDWPSGWREMRSVPGSPTSKPVKDGAWLAKHAGGADANPVFYVAKGNKALDFYVYDPTAGDSGHWYDRALIPSDEAGRAKPPSKGCVGVSDGERYVYMTKGNNTLGFWRYDVVNNRWDSLEGVPLGRYNKRVKGGNDLMYADYRDTGCVYLLKGYKTEFYRYNTLAGRWETLEEVPYGYNKQKYDKGSFLVYDDDNTIYAHQAKYYDRSVTNPHHYMFRYDIQGDSWYHTAKKGMPIYGLEGGRENKKKKSKDGAAGAWYDNSIYALKGGNTQGFFKYFPAPDSWVQLETMPSNGSFGRKKRVKGGGDFAAWGSGAFFALKGNKTYEFWRYVVSGVDSRQPAEYGGRSGAMAGEFAVTSLQFAVHPNPIAAGFVTLRVQGLQGSRVPVADLRIFDVMGRCVLVRPLVIGDWSLGIPLDLRRLSAGVYLVRLDAEGQTATQKLVVQR